MAGRLAFVLSAGAVLWCAALVPLLTPAFDAADEPLVPLAIPLVLAAGVFGLLHRMCKTGSQAAGSVAAVLAGLLVAYAFVTGFSIGMAIMPAALAALAAATVMPDR